MPIPSRRRLAFAAFLLFMVDLCMGGGVKGAEKISATIHVKDSLAAPRQEVAIEAKVVAKGLLGDAPVGGEPVELVVNGTVAARGMTGGDGRALLHVQRTAKSIVPVQVRVSDSPRVSAAEGQANLVVWERRTPVLVVELSSLMEDTHADGPLSALSPEPKPLANAADELAKLSQFYYGILYAVTVAPGADGFTISTETRNWLKTHSFPAGFVLTLPPADDAVGVKIDELHEAGWKSIKTGIGRSKAFVEAFLRRRLDAIMVPEPAKGEAPRKVKVAKDWKDVRKKL